LPGLAVLGELETGRPYEVADAAAERVAKGIEEIAGRYGFDVVVKHVSSMFQLYFKRGDVKTPDDVRKSDEKLYLKLHEIALRHGVYLAPSQYEVNFTTAAHTREVVDQALQSLEESFRELKAALRRAS